MATGKPTFRKLADGVNRETLSGAFFWLSAFYFVYCIRPEDLTRIPYLAKITVAGVFIALLSSGGRAQRKLKDLPIEAKYLLAMSAVLFLSALLSPVWRGGALVATIDFSKVVVAWILTFLLVTSMGRLRRIIFVQAGSVAAIALVSIIKGHNTPRLEGVMGGIYTNPNDLAFAIVLSFPFCFAFLLTSKHVLIKAVWVVCMLAMLGSLFLTASRAGFIDLVISGAVCLWHFGVRGRRMYLIVIVVFVGTLFFAVAGRTLITRFGALSGHGGNGQFEGAYGSYEQRKYLMIKAVEGIEHYPILGIGVHNFRSYSGTWRDVHMTYLQIAVEGGIPSLMLYLLFFYRGFANLKYLRWRRDLDSETTVFVGALHSSLVGFVVGALFAPEAYHYFPYFTVAYTASLLAMVKAREQSEPTVAAAGPDRRMKYWMEVYDTSGKAGTVRTGR
jgi:O-antigen ligase